MGRAGGGPRRPRRPRLRARLTVRGCLTSFFVLIALGLIASWLLLPPIASGAIDQGLQLAGFHGDGRRVTVVASPPLELLTLHADTVRVQASDVTYQGLQAGSVDVTLGDVALLDRTAGTIDGTLTAVSFRGVDGLTVSVASIGPVGDRRCGRRHGRPQCL